MTSEITAITALIVAITTMIATITTLVVTIKGVKPKVDDAHAKITEVANGQRARIDQLEQTVQAAGVPIPPAPLHAAETASEPT